MKVAVGLILFNMHKIYIGQLVFRTKSGLQKYPKEGFCTILVRSGIPPEKDFYNLTKIKRFGGNEIVKIEINSFLGYTTWS